jgi:hypothetical protein
MKYFSLRVSESMSNGKTTAILYLCISALLIYSVLLAGTRGDNWFSNSPGLNQPAKEPEAKIITLHNPLANDRSIVRTDLLPVELNSREKLAYLSKQLLSFTRKWGHKSMTPDWMLTPLGLNMQIQSGHRSMPQYIDAPFLGWPAPSGIADLQQAAVAMAPKPMLEATAFWRTLSVYLCGENIAQERMDGSKRPQGHTENI